MIPTGYNRELAWDYRGVDVEVRLQGEETINFMSPTGEITRTYTSSTVRALVGPEKQAPECRARLFSFLAVEFPQNPVSKTTRLVYEDLVYEISGWSISADGVRVDITTYRP